MSGAAVAVGAAIVISGYMQSEAQKKAAENAADAQDEGTKAAIAEQRRQFEAIQNLLKPYVESGKTSLTAQMALAGLAGPESQQNAISQIENSPIFNSLVKQGEQGILQNASATGGLRGGNIQSVLAQYRPAMLKTEIEDQYNRLASISQLGQASAAGTATAGTQLSGNVSNLLLSAGNARAQQALLTGAADAKLWGSVGNAAGFLYGANQNSNRNF